MWASPLRGGENHNTTRRAPIPTGPTPPPAPRPGGRERNATAKNNSGPRQARALATGPAAQPAASHRAQHAGDRCMAALEAERFLAAHGEAEPRVAAE